MLPLPIMSVTPGLPPGRTYTLTGTLMDKSTKKAFVDADGNPVTATAEFTAEAESGTATVTFTFNASSIKTGTKLIAFETPFHERYRDCRPQGYQRH